MGFGLRVVSELLWYFVGLDLGQSRNYSALAVVERAEVFLDDMDWVTYERRRKRRYRVPFLERVRQYSREQETRMEQVTGSESLTKARFSATPRPVSAARDAPARDRLSLIKPPALRGVSNWSQSRHHCTPGSWKNSS